MRREDEVRARLAAINFVQEQSSLREDILPWGLLTSRFAYHGERITLIGAQGIWRPAGFEVPISISTAPVEEGRKRPYDDEWTADALLVYHYRRGGAEQAANAGLRLARQRSTPLIYFHGVAKGKYVAACPVFIVGDDRHTATFTVSIDDPPALMQGIPPVGDSRRRYVTRLVQQRMHQAEFRVRVLAAYRQMCAMCRLRHVELLDAAHILPDSDPDGMPTVSNGLALCKLHHAAFDSHLVGVRPGGLIVVRSDLLRETDGPMLRHGLQGLNGQKIETPIRSELRPSEDFLARRFELFLRTA